MCKNGPLNTQAAWKNLQNILLSEKESCTEDDVIHNKIYIYTHKNQHYEFSIDKIGKSLYF